MSAGPVSPAYRPAQARAALDPPSPRTATKGRVATLIEIPGLGEFRMPDPTQIPGMRGLKLEFDVNAKGELLVSSNLLGLLPVTTKIDIDDALAGKYGKGILADMKDPGNTSLSGDLSFKGFPVALPALDIGGTDLAQAFSFLQGRITEPNRIVVDGRYRSGQEGLPFHADIRATKLGPGVYDLALNDLRLGSWNIPIPAFLAAFVGWFMLKVLRGVDGVTMAGYGRLRVDLKAATASQNQPSR